MDDELKSLCKRMRLAYVYDYVMDHNEKDTLYSQLLNTLKYEQQERLYNK